MKPDRSRAPVTYRDQDGCWNCRHVERIHEYDCGPTYYCGFKGPKRPPSMSVAMGELVRPIGGKAYDAAWSKWDAWSEGRKVEAQGKCDDHAAMERR